MRKKQFYFLILFLSLTELAFADAVFLKKGDIIEGTLAAETDQTVVLSVETGKTEIFNKNEILRVVFNTEYKNEVYVYKKDKTVKKGFIVYEKAGSYIVREKLDSPVEITVRKDDVEFISDRGIRRELVVREDSGFQTPAGGIGFFWSHGRGLANLRFESNFVDAQGNQVSKKTDAEYSFNSFGLLFDSSVNDKNLINFRMFFDFKFASLRNSRNTGILHYTMTDIEKAYGVGLYMAWGFAFFRSDFLRLWAGPEIGFGGYWGDDLNTPAWSFSDFFIGIGAVMGINICVTEKFAVSLEGGYRLNSRNASLRSTKDRYVQIGSEYYENTVFVSGAEHEFFVLVAAVYIKSE